MSNTNNTHQTAGEYGAWLQATRIQLRENKPADVPCGNCNACCRSGYFIHIEADETATLAQIPDTLLHRAPAAAGLPGNERATWVMGFDETGSCPMLVEGRCSIYAHRPRTCRAYDCRVFAAAAQPAGDAARAAVNQQVERWRFTYATQAAQAKHNAVKSAARFLLSYPDDFAAHTENPTRLAMCALSIYELFLPPVSGQQKSPAQMRTAVLSALQPQPGS